jgi:hypothetical protein
LSKNQKGSLGYGPGTPRNPYEDGGTRVAAPAEDIGLTNPYWVITPSNQLLSVHEEDHFETERHLAFSPLTQEMSIENLLLFFAIFKLSRSPEGIKTLERLAVKYIDATARIIESIQASSKSNWLTALNNQHITAAMVHRIGLIDDGGYLKIVDHYRNVFDKLYVLDAALSALGGVTTLVEGSTSKVTPAYGGTTELGGLATILHALKP